MENVVIDLFHVQLHAKSNAVWLQELAVAEHRIDPIRWALFDVIGAEPPIDFEYANHLIRKFLGWCGEGKVCRRGILWRGAIVHRINRLDVSGLGNREILPELP